MIRSKDFFQAEADAPLLTRNYHFLKNGDNTAVFERVAKWPALVGIEEVPVITPRDSIAKALQIMLENKTNTMTIYDPEKKENVATITANNDFVERHANPYDEEFDRIAIKDAIRTFRSKTNQNQMIAMLHRLYAVFQDYHQALGYVASFLSLTIDEETVVKMLYRIGQDEKYVPGYWKTFPEAYARDAMVYERLLEQSHPRLAKHLRTAGVVPEAYVSKWFIGDCIHVLPFPSLFDFFEAYLEEGYMFLFKWAIALCETLQERLLATPVSDVSKLFAILRLDAEHFPDDLEDTGFFKDVVKMARSIEIPQHVVAEYRKTQWDALQERLVTERLKTQKLQDEDSDDEIVFSDEEDDEEDPEERLRRLAEEN